MYYSDYITNQILVANLNGSGSTPLMEDELEVPGGCNVWLNHHLVMDGLQCVAVSLHIFPQ